MSIFRELECWQPASISCEINSKLFVRLFLKKLWLIPDLMKRKYEEISCLRTGIDRAAWP